MDRESTIVVLLNANNNQLTMLDVVKTIKDYCLEHGKNELLTMQFIKGVINTPLATRFFEESLSYFDRKYEIARLWSAPDLSGERHLLRFV